MRSRKPNEVYMNFYSVKDIGTEKKAREFFQLLIDQGKDFVPEKISKTEPLRGKFDLNDINAAAHMWLDCGKNPDIHSSTIMMSNKASFKVSIMVNWHRCSNASFNFVTVWLSPKCLLKNYGIEALLSFGEKLFDFTGALYGFISRVDVEISQFVAGTLITRLPGIFWANFFGPLYIDFFGKDKVENAPCYQKRTLSHGGMLLLTSETPTGLDNPVDRESENLLREYLDHDAFPDLSKEKKDSYTPEELRAGLQNVRVQHNTPVFDFSEVRKGFVKKEMTIKENAIKDFTQKGWKFVGELENGTLEFKDKKGGVLRYTAGPNGSIDHFPDGLPDYLKYAYKLKN